jgi:hypothetical protein
MLDDLERKGYIKRLPVDKRKVNGSLQLAKRDITVARGCSARTMTGRSPSRITRSYKPCAH